MVDFGIAKWHHHKSMGFDGMDFFNNLKSLVENYLNLKHT
jgi:hypothetical protein